MFETVIIVFVALAAGLGIGYLVGKSRFEPLTHAAQAESSRLATQLEEERKLSQSHLDKAREEARQQADARISEMRTFMQESLRQMEQRFSGLAGQVLDDQKLKLEKDANTHLNLLLKPLEDNLQHLHQELQDSKLKGVAQHTSFLEAIKRLEEQAASVGREADNLARALKTDSKLQGDWGEMVLDTLLERSGLTKGVEYQVQENFHTEDGRNVRPDVVVYFPEGRSIIIDSKVSLTAFADYTRATDDAERAEALKRHLESVRAHVVELSDKNYPKDVKGSPEYVIMFMPTEASYLAAVGADDKLNLFAWERKVILACPNILIMTLQIINNVWQSARQTKNVEKVIDAANKLYSQFALFAESFEQLGKSIDSLDKSYGLARKRLLEGKGNFVGRLESMRQLGLAPKKDMPTSLTEAADEA